MALKLKCPRFQQTWVLSSSKLLMYSKIAEIIDKICTKCSSSLNFQSVLNVVEGHSCVKGLFRSLIKPITYLTACHLILIFYVLFIP